MMKNTPPTYEFATVTETQSRAPPRQGAVGDTVSSRSIPLPSEVPTSSCYLMTDQTTGPLIAPETVLGGEGQTCLSLGSVRSPWGWIGWIASVVAVSTLINVAGSFILALFARTAIPAVVHVAKGTPPPPPFSRQHAIYPDTLTDTMQPSLPSAVSPGGIPA
jgi:hypothetical protein